MRRTTRLILLLAGATLVALMIWKTGPGVLLAGLRHSAWVVAALLPLWIIVYTLNAVAWRMLTSDGGKPMHFTLGDGGARVVVHTFKGEIRILKP